MIKEQIRQAIFEIIQANWPEAKVALDDIVLEKPADDKFGDYTTNIAMRLAKEIKMKPMDVAKQLKELKSKVKGLERVEEVEPGFVNFYLDNQSLVAVLNQVIKQGDKYGQTGAGKGQTVIVDYSAPNISKPMHIGHLRSTIIGQSLYNIYKFLGYKTIGDSHLGDWGTQFGKLLVMYKQKHGDKPVGLTIDDLTKLYVSFHKQVEKNETLDEILS